jgi:hypothetical protein
MVRIKPDEFFSRMVKNNFQAIFSSGRFFFGYFLPLLRT